MKILISNANNQPIYEQIYTQIRNQILSGELAPGQGLPSIRALAKDLRVSVITTKRAYEELEKGGYVYTVPAKGSYVAQQSTQLVREAYLTQIEEHIQEILSLSAACGLARETGATGALALYISNGSVSDFQPMNINFGLIPPLGYRVKGKRNKNAELSRRALEVLDTLDM